MSQILAKAATLHRKKLVFFGDFAQAMAVKDSNFTESELFRSIQAAGHVIKLTRSHRQTKSPFLDALTQLRRGEMTPEVLNILSPAFCHDESQIGLEWLRLYATNKATDSYNSQRLLELPTVGVSVHLITTFTDTRSPSLRDEKPMTDEQQAKHIADSSFADGLSLKINARIILTKNEGGGEGGYVNGDTGTVTDITFADGTSARDAKPVSPFETSTADRRVDSITIHVDRFGYDIQLSPTSQEMKDAAGRPLFMLNGFTLMLGWAMSIHRVQGMTIPKVAVDVATITYMQGESKHGLLYVACSRVRDIADLKLLRWTPDALYCAPALLPFI